jgi:ribosomal protein S18 acetylase RimI-like enzyme
MSLVPVAPPELPALAAFINAAYRGRSAEQGWAHEAGYITGQRIDADMLREDLAANRGAQLLAWREGESLLGCVWLEPDADGVWKLGLLTVRPDQQDRGLGRTLLAAAEAHAAARGARRIGITVVHLRDALIAWYERRGYVRTGETAPFPYGDERFGVPIRDDLCFILMEKAL